MFAASAIILSLLQATAVTLPPGVEGRTYSRAFARNERVTFVQPCTGGKLAISGGYHRAGTPALLDILSSRPDTDGRAWIIVVLNRGRAVSSVEFTIYAVCR